MHSPSAKAKRSTGNALARAENEAEARGLLVEPLVAEDEGLASSPARRRTWLSAKVAHDLYRDLHRRRVLVLAFDDVQVPRNPSRRPATDAHLIKLGAFVAHKALYRRTPHAGLVKEAFEHYDSWIGEQGCDGPSDPRALPLHVFEAPGDWSHLGTPEANRAFGKRYAGPKGAKTDAGGKVWKRDAHGLDRLTIAGRELPPGVHWDVNTAGSKANVMNGIEIWQVGRSHGYVNVSPDAHFREGSKLSTAIRVWPPRGQPLGKVQKQKMPHNR